MTMQNKNNIKKLVTHNGSFHSDDIFACATLCLMLEKRGEQFEIIRTRDPEIIKNGDYVFDLGGIYDAGTNRFDHHQVGGAGGRSFDGVKIEYSSAGLIWKKFGIEICESPKIVDILDKKLIAPIDADDNGVDLVLNKFKISPYLIKHLFSAMRPTWREEDLSKDKMFLKSVEIAKIILSREIIQAQDIVLAEDSVISIYNKTQDKKIIVLDNKYPFENILNNFQEPIFAVYPRKVTGDWAAESIRDDLKNFKNRKNFPKSWAGLFNEELQKISNVNDAIFCHRGLFVAVAKSKEGAIKLAQIAVES